MLFLFTVKPTQPHLCRRLKWNITRLDCCDHVHNARRPGYLECVLGGHLDSADDLIDPLLELRAHRHVMMDVHHVEFPRRRRAQLGMSEKILANSRELENLIGGTDTPKVSPRSGSHDKFHRSPLSSTIYRKVLRPA